MKGLRELVESERWRLQQTDISLKEWGRWSATGDRPKLGYPRVAPFLKEPRGADLEDFDLSRVEEVENAYTTWLMVTKASTHGHIRKHGLLLLFILKIHYCEAGNSSDKIHHTSRMFHTQLSRWKYYKLLQEARVKLATLIY